MQIIPCPNRSVDCCKCSSKDLEPTFLCFRTCVSEMKFQRQPDPNFWQYVGASTVIFLFMAAIQVLTDENGAHPLNLPMTKRYCNNSQISLVPTSRLMVLALSTTGCILIFFLIMAWTRTENNGQVHEIARTSTMYFSSWMRPSKSSILVEFWAWKFDKQP